ncbi:MAG: tripartite tricarboxylate transporter TctB family protein [Desulfovibrio sp.]|nr:tripartite tricarboxylate transporter TctB family protein [Desulfovibrio sp.]
MKLSDSLVILFMYGVCLFFYILIGDLPEDSRTYPLTIVAGLAVLTTCFLLRQIPLLFRSGIRNDFPVVFDAFLGRQFFVICLLCVAFLALLPITGFYVTALIFLILAMFFLRVPLPHLCATIAVLGALIYVVFTLFLKVPMPVGTLFQ